MAIVVVLQPTNDDRHRVVDASSVSERITTESLMGVAVDGGDTATGHSGGDDCSSKSTRFSILDDNSGLLGMLSLKHGRPLIETPTVIDVSVVLGSFFSLLLLWP